MGTKPAQANDQLLPTPFVEPPGFYQQHQEDQRRRAAAREAKRQELERCLDPKYAAKKESEKPHFRFTVEAEWLGSADDVHTRFDSKQVVIAQDESDAWAMFCDKIGHWPSPRAAKRKITRGREVSVSELVTEAHDETDEMPRKTIGPQTRPLMA